MPRLGFSKGMAHTYTLVQCLDKKKIHLEPKKLTPPNIPRQKCMDPFFFSAFLVETRHLRSKIHRPVEGLELRTEADSICRELQERTPGGFQPEISKL